MLAPYPPRLRSHSSPAQPERSTPPPDVAPAPAQHSAFAAVEEASELQGNSSHPQSSPRAPSHTSRRAFRLKRPSGSTSAMEHSFSHEPALPTDVHIPSHAGNSSSPSQTRPPVSLPSPLRRVGSRSGSRPSTSVGPPPPPPLPEQPLSRVRSSSASVSDVRRDSSLFKGLGPIMGVRAGPPPETRVHPINNADQAGTDFMLQRRKSRGSRQPTHKASSAVPQVQEEAPAAAHKFSTPDRTVLQELKHKMQAREAQFQTRNGKKHHPYPPDEVPYPRSYERNVVDSDIWECMWAREAMHGQQTWYKPDRPPGKVLDLGCGTGTWLLDSALDWKETHFVGLDIVPLHPDLTQIGPPQLAKRITWIQANFLEKLPFPNEEFDFVHAKRIARGVPEDKWDSLIEEVHRVLKPGGVFGLFEEELTFPGKPLIEDNPPDTIDLTKSLPSTSSVTSSASSTISEDLHMYSSQNSSMSDFVFSFNPNPDLSLTADLSPTQRPQSQPEQRRPRTLDSTGFSSVLSLGLMSPTAMPVSPTQPRAAPRPPASSPRDERQEHELLDVLALSRTPDPANDPRDHSLLEYIYNEMHAARFINLEPLALLENNLSISFKELFTHPPIIFTFPPSPYWPHSYPGSAPGKQSDHRASMESKTPVSPEYPPPMSFQQIAAGCSPYVMFDGDRATRRQPRSAGSSGASSSSTSPIPSRPGTPGNPPVRNIRPLPEVTFDHRALNMHLHLRVEDVLGCAEAMWQFVLDYQERHLESGNPATGKEQRQDRPRPTGRVNRELHQELMGLHRREFDAMLTRFRLDMEDNTFLSHAVNTRLTWPYVRSPKPPERVEFEELCEKWEKHLAELTLRAPATQGKHAHNDSLSSNTATASSRSSIISTAPSESTEPATPRPGQGPPQTPVSSVTACSTSKDSIPGPRRKVHPSERISRMCRAFVAWK